MPCSIETEDNLQNIVIENRKSIKEIIYTENRKKNDCLIGSKLYTINGYNKMVTTLLSKLKAISDRSSPLSEYLQNVFHSRLTGLTGRLMVGPE